MKLELVRKLFHLVGPLKHPGMPPNVVHLQYTTRYVDLYMCRGPSVHFSVFDFNKRGPLAGVYAGS